MLRGLIKMRAGGDDTAPRGGNNVRRRSSWSKASGVLQGARPPISAHSG
jgi:hypothetical protein